MASIKNRRWRTTTIISTQPTEGNMKATKHGGILRENLFKSETTEPLTLGPRFIFQRDNGLKRVYLQLKRWGPDDLHCHTYSIEMFHEWIWSFEISSSSRFKLATKLLSKSQVEPYQHHYSYIQKSFKSHKSLSAASVPKASRDEDVLKFAWKALHQFVHVGQWITEHAGHAVTHGC